MAALDLNNFMLPTGPYLGYTRNDFNNFIRNCYATNDPTNNINRIMTIEEDEEDDEEEGFGRIGEIDVGSSVYFEKRHKRIEDWNKVYNSDEENNGAVEKSSGNGEVDENVNGASEEVGSVSGLGEKKKSTDSVKSGLQKSLKVTFADEFGCDLIQNFIIRNNTDDDEDDDGEEEEDYDQIKMTEDEEEGEEEEELDEVEDSDKENLSGSSNRGKHKCKKMDDIGFESLQLTINKLFGNDITLSNGDISFGGDVELGGDVDLGGGAKLGGDVEFGKDVALGVKKGDKDPGGAISLGDKGVDVDLGSSSGDVVLGERRSVVE